MAASRRCLLLLVATAAASAFQMSALRGERRWCGGDRDGGVDLTAPLKVSPASVERRRRVGIRSCAEPQPDAERTAEGPPADAETTAGGQPEDKLEPVKKVSEFTLGAGAKELQRILIGTEFGLQVGLLTLAFGGLMCGSTVLLRDDPFWSSPLFPQ